VPATFSVPGARDVDVADGTFPLVLFSHGFSGVRVQSTFLTSHLARWGFVVAAPDHSARTLSTVLGSGPATPSDPVEELLATLDTVTAEPSPLAAAIDAGSVIALGHSAGGFTVATAAAADDRIDGFVSMASGSNAQGTAPATTPSFFIAGSLDAVVPPADRTEPAFEAAASPSLYWLIDGVGHNGFDDFCTFGNGTGIIGVAEASGLEALLDAQPQFRTLGEDGCLPPALPVVDTFPVITHAVTAWIRWQTGADPDPVALGLDDSPLPFDDVTVTVRSR
jgi:predicted dienelactone hydrolase